MERETKQKVERKDVYTSSTARGGAGSFKKVKYI